MVFSRFISKLVFSKVLFLGGVRITHRSLVENTTSAQATSSCAPTPHFGPGRRVIYILQMGKRQLWAEDVQDQFSTAATPGILQSSTLMRYLSIYLCTGRPKKQL